MKKVACSYSSLSAKLAHYRTVSLKFTAKVFFNVLEANSRPKYFRGEEFHRPTGINRLPYELPLYAYKRGSEVLALNFTM